MSLNKRVRTVLARQLVVERTLAISCLTWDMHLFLQVSTLLLCWLSCSSDGTPIRTLFNRRCVVQLPSGSINLESLARDGGEQARFTTVFAGIRFTFRPCVPSGDSTSDADSNQPLLEADLPTTDNSSNLVHVVLGTKRSVAFRPTPKVFCHRHGTNTIASQCLVHRLISNKHLKTVQGEDGYDEKNLEVSEENEKPEEDEETNVLASDGQEEDVDNSEEDVHEKGRKEEEGHEDEEEEEEGEDNEGDNLLEPALLPYTHSKPVSYPRNVTAIMKLENKAICRGYRMIVLLQCNPDIWDRSETVFRVVYSQCANKLHFLLSHRCCCVGLCSSVSGTNYHQTVNPDSNIELRNFISSVDKPVIRQDKSNGTVIEASLLDDSVSMPRYIWLVVVVNLIIIVVAIIIGSICCSNSSMLANTTPQSYGYFTDFLSLRHEALYSSRLTVYSRKDSLGQVQPLPSQIADQRDYSSSKTAEELPQPTDSSIPSRAFDLGPRLGGGLFGDTYIADWRDRTVAAKRITVGIQHGQPEEGLYQWLLKETKKLSEQRHKHLAAVFGVCTETRQPYILTEYVEGETLKCILEERNIRWQNKIKICTQIADGLAYLHSARPPILHRDLRCANVIIDKYDRVKIVDFGMTKVIQKMRQLCDGNKGCFCKKDWCSLPASVRWTAPEILKHPTADESTDVIKPACDVYSFGIVMWEMASHRDPFEDIPDDSEVISLVIAGARPELTELSGMIRPVRELMTLCWDSDPGVRPTSKQVLCQLKCCQEELNRTAPRR